MSDMPTELSVLLLDAGCVHRGKRQRFGDPARMLIEQCATGRDGITRCQYPGCDWEQNLECHHIRPSWAGGLNTADNGIALCRNHHALADRGVIPPEELQAYKRHFIRRYPLIRDLREIDSLISIAHTSDECPKRCDLQYRYRARVLRRLRACVARRESMLTEIRRSIAWTQLDMAGALCSWLSADSVQFRESERYEVDMHARHAHLLGRALRDPMLMLRAQHTLAVNANALRDHVCARRYSIRADQLRNSTTIVDVEFHAYLTRNLASILARCGDVATSTNLLRTSASFSDSISTSGRAETLMRSTEILMVRGDLQRAGRVIEMDLQQLPRLSPIQQVIRLRIQGQHACLVGHMEEGLIMYANALEKADRYRLGHQSGQIRAAMHCFCPDLTAEQPDAS